MKNILYALCLSLLLWSCKTTQQVVQSDDTNFRWVGDIQPDAKLDDPNFTTCFGDERIYQYFNFSDEPSYVGEKPALMAQFKTNYRPVKGKNQDGFIRIRFVVNCKGKAGRFRTLQSDENFQTIKFDKKVVNQILDLTKQIDNWEIVYNKNEPVDYYQYLIFKINDGELTEILP